MYCMTTQLNPKAGLDQKNFEDSIRDTVASLSHNGILNLGRNLEGSFGTGEYTCDFLSIHSQQEILDVLTQLNITSNIDLVIHQPIAGALRSPQLKNGISRTLLLKVKEDATEDQLYGLENDTLAMPDHLQGICNWSFSRTVDNSKWSHVWQQEYANLGDLTGEYMTHPYHWAWVDRWFDSEIPEHCVESTLCHAFCELPSSLLAEIDKMI